MSRKLLTDEEVLALRNHHGVASVSARTVVFTAQFKKKIYDRLLQGEAIKDILESEGINTAALGKTRLNGLQEKIYKQANREEGFANLKKERRPKTKEEKEASLQAQIRQLQHELAYTKQEVEFLKKVQAADMEARKQWESKQHRK